MPTKALEDILFFRGGMPAFKCFLPPRCGASQNVAGGDLVSVACRVTLQSTDRNLESFWPTIAGGSGRTAWTRREPDAKVQTWRQNGTP